MTTQKQHSKWSAVVFILFASLFFILLTRYANHHTSIVINEVCSNNFSIMKNQLGDYSDYIELYNAGSKTISLKGWRLLSENEKELPYEFGDVSMEPGSYLLLIYQNDSLSESQVTPPPYFLRK